jgi:hypothetical protein
VLDVASVGCVASAEELDGSPAPVASSQDAHEGKHAFVQRVAGAAIAGLAVFEK